MTLASIMDTVISSVHLKRSSAVEKDDPHIIKNILKIEACMQDEIEELRNEVKRLRTVATFLGVSTQEDIDFINDMVARTTH